MHATRKRLGIIQRVLPSYRTPFFDRLSQRYGGTMELFVGAPHPAEGIRTGSLDVGRQVPAANIHIGYGRWYFCWQRGLLKWLRTFQPDLLLVDLNPRTLSTLAAVVWMKLRGRPVLGWGLGLLDWSAPGWVLAIRKLVLGIYYRCFDAIVAYSTRAAADYAALGVTPSRLFVARNAVTAAHAERLALDLQADPDWVLRWKADLGLSDRPVVLFVGRLLAQKRVADLITACSRCGSGCDLLVVGDGPERAALEALARQVFPQTRFLGHKEGAELALCFGAADLFVLPGLGGLALHEAMIYGKPVVVASGDGTQHDLVIEARTGFHFEAGDISALVTILQDCLANPGQLQAMGQEAARLVREEHNLDLMVESFLKAFSSQDQS